jgi:hypothetical protein
LSRSSIHSSNLFLLLLSQEELESSLKSNALARPLVVGRETSRVSGLGDLSLSDLLQGVKAVALSVESVHQMHCGGCLSDEKIGLSGGVFAVLLVKLLFAWDRIF